MSFELENSMERTFRNLWEFTIRFSQKGDSRHPEIRLLKDSINKCTEELKNLEPDSKEYIELVIQREKLTEKLIDIKSLLTFHKSAGSMRKVFIFIFLFSYLFYSPLYAGQYKVSRVIDGDTVQALAGASKIRIRLVGIDAPEFGRGKRDPGQPFCRQSQKTLAALVLNQVVEIKSYGQDQYDRTLAEIFCKNKNINLEMIRSGMAEVYRGRQPKGLNIQSYRDMEQQAQASKIGIWSLGSKYQSPKEWRKEKRAQ